MTLPPPIPFEEAQARLIAGVSALPSETIPVGEAIGRYLAVDSRALRTQPAADLSAMDGYAVPLGDLAGPWRVVGESAAGHPFSGTLDAGQAARISTGALMPQGSGAVLLQEEAQRSGDELSLVPPGEPSARHIRRRGFDFDTGDVLLAAGTRIGSAQLALLLSGGHAAVEVGCLPRVAVLDSGDELAADPAGCAPHQIPASNGAMLAALARPLAASVSRIGPVRDTREALAHALARADGTDVLVTSGGASVGDHDLLRPALEAWGARIAFWRVAIKPGKPLMIARKGAQWIVGLPGNPVSSFVTAQMFLLPLLRALAGAAAPLPVPLRLPLCRSLPATGNRSEFVRARLQPEGALPLGEQDSSALHSLSSADALIYRPANCAPASEGAAVPVYRIENGCNA